MRLIFTFILAGCLFKFSHAAILTVSQTTAFPAKYATIQQAIDSASVGDTIYIYPGNYPETPTIKKRLVIIGPGISPHRPTRLTAVLSGIKLNGNAASGSVIMGLYMFYGTVFGDDGSELINNLLVAECGFRGGVKFNGYGNLLENCILNYPDYGITIIFSCHNAIGNIIQNSYINGTIFVRPGSNTQIRNNIFASKDANTLSFSILNSGDSWGSAVVIENNIFYKSNPNGPAGSTSGCEFKNNIYHLTNNPTPTNSFSSGNLNADPLFVNYPAGGDQFSFEYDYHLQASSPGIKYGTDGKDVGMWDGPSPVNAGFEPPIPRIYSLKATNSTTPAGGTIQLTIKASKAQ